MVIQGRLEVGEVPGTYSLCKKMSFHKVYKGPIAEFGFPVLTVPLAFPPELPFDLLPGKTSSRRG